MCRRACDGGDCFFYIAFYTKYSYREGLFIRRNPGIDVYKINILNNNKETNILIFRTGLFMIKNVFYSLNSKNKTFGIIDEIINNSRK